MPARRSLAIAAGIQAAIPVAGMEAVAVVMTHTATTTALIMAVTTPEESRGLTTGAVAAVVTAATRLVAALARPSRTRC